MWNDVVDLRDFYASGLGQITRRMIRGRIRAVWNDVSGQRVMGLGFATPYLGLFRGEAERVAAVMPAPLGVLAWPRSGPGLVTLADETELPFPDRSIDRVLLVHALESTEHVRAMMREIWRVLSDGGRLLAIVPNRRGIWARLDGTPFGQGRPYTAAQLNRLLRDTLFLPLGEGGALYMPPFHSRMMLGSAPAWEKVGGRWFPHFAGVVMMEAAKQIYAAGTPSGVRERKRAYASLGLRQG